MNNIEVIDICAALESIKSSKPLVFETISNVIFLFDDYISSNKEPESIKSQDKLLCEIGALFNQLSSM